MIHPSSKCKMILDITGIEALLLELAAIPLQAFRLMPGLCHRRVDWLFTVEHGRLPIELLRSAALFAY